MRRTVEVPMALHELTANTQLQYLRLLGNRAGFDATKGAVITPVRVENGQIILEVEIVDAAD